MRHATSAVPSPLEAPTKRTRAVVDMTELRRRFEIRSKSRALTALRPNCVLEPLPEAAGDLFRRENEVVSATTREQLCGRAGGKGTNYPRK